MTTPPNTQPTAEQIVAELRAGLEGATPGPWTVIRSHPNDGWNGWYLRSSGVEEDICQLRGRYPPQLQQDAAHIARCSPDRIATLLDAFDAQAREIAELREIVDGLLAQIAAVHGSDGYRNMQEIMRVNNAVLAENYELVKENATLRAKENLNV